MRKLFLFSLFMLLAVAVEAATLTAGYVPKAQSGKVIVDSIIYSDGTNVGIGSASPRGKLDVDGVIYGDGSGITGISGSISGLNAGYLSRANSTSTITDSAIYENIGNIGIGTVNPLGLFEVKGSGSSYFSTNVGIGTSEPTTTLHVEGTLYTKFLGVNTLSPTALLEVKRSASVNSFAITNSSYADFFAVNSNGNVGIGSTVPASRLSVSGIGATTGKAFQVANSSHSPKFIVFDSGNIGISTIDPKAKVEIDGAIYVGKTAPSYIDLTTTGNGLFNGSVEIDGAVYFDGNIFTPSTQGVTGDTCSHWTKGICDAI